ncbi:MAG: hypothetical protein FWH11_08820 [Micrococcales bacterium]|nr:hypothetical protein [Micrococcales bacterium]
MKRGIALLTLLALLGVSPPGWTPGVKIDTGTSTKFSDVEIRSAAYVVMAEFYYPLDRVFGPELRAVRYDEAASDREISLDLGGPLLAGVSPENAIMLYADFYAGSESEEYGLSPGMHTDYKYVLVRDDTTSRWRVVTWGYA